MNKAFDDLYCAVVELVDDLCGLDPKSETPEGKLLLGLTAALEEYEKSEFPLAATNSNKQE